MATGESTALARVKMPDAPIAKIEELRNQYERLASQVNLVTPIMSPDFIPEMHRVSLRAVVVSSQAEVGDVYHSPAFLKPNERALTKIAILKLLQAAGGTVVESARIDDRRDHYVAEFRVTVEIPQMDGTRRRFVATKGVDYRDGAPQVVAMQPNQIKAARQFVPELAESKALLRAVRGGLALKQKYSVDELAKPFVVPALVFDPDTSDPEIKRMVAAKGLGISDALYGPRPGAAPAAQQIGDGRERPEPAQDIETTAVTVDDDPDDFGEPPAPAPKETFPVEANLCTCRCECQSEVAQEIADRTRKAAGAVRCGTCYPWSARFDVKKHQALDALGMPSYPTVDGKKGAEENRAFLASRKAGAR